MRRLVRQLTLGAAVAIAAVGGVAAPVAADTSAPVRVIVKAEPGASAAEIAANADAEVTRTLIASRGVFEVAWPDAEDADRAQDEAKRLAKEIQKDDRVVWAEADYSVSAQDGRFHAWPLGSPADPGGIDPADQPAFAELDLVAAHALATGDGVVVAVLDTGVDAGHSMLAGSVLPGYDLVDDDLDAGEGANGVDDDGNGVADDAHGHGTFIAGVVRQIAPDVTILPVRVLDDEGHGEFYAIAEGIDIAVAAGADVINLSLGAGDRRHGHLLKDALKRARHADVVVVAAAGNAGTDDRFFPAADNEVVGVTALDGDGVSVAPFAGRGTWVDVAAPGVGIVSAMAGGGTVMWNGTSMATPVVSGQLALMIEARPDDDVRRLETRLWKSCRKLADKHLTAQGVIDVLESLR